MTNMTSKVYYSNSCPSIIVERDVDLSKPLILSHKNIAKNLIIPLCSIYLTYQTRVYDLDGSNKCKIEVIWGWVYCYTIM